MTIGCASVAKELGCKKFLCAGTVAERTVDSLNNLERTTGGMMYGIAKHCAHIMLETYCKNIGLDCVWMQFSNIYGSQNKTGNLVSYTVDKLLRGEPAIFGPALQPYDFIYVNDLIEAVYRLGSHTLSRHTYYIGSGSPRILKEYLYQIGREINKESLIRIDERPDDGIVYTFDMFDTKHLVEDIGI